MNDELLAVEKRLDARIDRLEEKVDRLQTNLDRMQDDASVRFERLINTIVQFGGELHADMQRMEDRLRDSFNHRNQIVETRLARHAGLLQSGARAILRLTESSDASDANLSELARQLDTFNARVTKLEYPSQN